MSQNSQCSARLPIEPHLCGILLLDMLLLLVVVPRLRALVAIWGRLLLLSGLLLLLLLLWGRHARLWRHCGRR
jgi:hypothetical protein